MGTPKTVAEQVSKIHTHGKPGIISGILKYFSFYLGFNWFWCGFWIFLLEDINSPFQTAIRTFKWFCCIGQ